MPSPDLTIVVFAFDESENIEPVLTELRSWLAEHEPESEVVFVDDGSRDDTAARASSALEGFPHRILRHPHNRGIGAALKTGVGAAIAPWVTFLPADGQIAPDAIATLRAAAADGAVDAVFSVYADRDDGLDRTLLSWGMRALVRAVHGVRLESDGPYLFRRTLFAPEALASDSFFLNLEFPIQLLSEARPTRVVTIACRPRRSGHSKSARLRVIGRVARELVALRLRRAFAR